jgi:hypothetical protein
VEGRMLKRSGVQLCMWCGHLRKLASREQKERETEQSVASTEHGREKGTGMTELCGNATSVVCAGIPPCCHKRPEGRVRNSDLLGVI